MRPRLMTSNESKLKEFRRLGIDAEIGGPAADLVEPLADPLFTCAHKAFTCGPGSLCEDTRLDVDGADIGVLAKFLLEALPTLQGRRATFACCLALARDSDVVVWEGRVEGAIVDAMGAGGFGFDPFFAPDGGQGLRMGELDALGRKDEFSARARVCQSYLDSDPIAVFSFEELAKFQGPWQESEPSAAPAKRPAP